MFVIHMNIYTYMCIEREIDRGREREREMYCVYIYIYIYHVMFIYMYVCIYIYIHIYIFGGRELEKLLGSLRDPGTPAHMFQSCTSKGI